MSELNRREFIKNMAIGGALLGLGGIMVHKTSGSIGQRQLRHRSMQKCPGKMCIGVRLV